MDAEAPPLIQFHKDIANEVVSFDGLWLLGTGLGLTPLLERILVQYEHHKELVIVLNIDPSRFSPLFAESNPLIVAEGITAEQRKARYLRGGILFITSRILVVDMLRQRLPGHLIAGFFVANAHRVTDSSTESFILRLYRESNKTGFIKAFSDEPHAFTGGFGSLEKSLRALFVKRLFLWPRFKKSVGQTLDVKQPDVTQAFVPMTQYMMSIQKSLIEVASECLKELGKGSTVDLSGFDVASIFTRPFHRMLRTQLDPVWHQTSKKTKQLVSDLEVIRRLGLLLTKFDSVGFYEHLDALKKKEVSEKSLWIMMEQANSIFQYGRARVFKTTKITEEPDSKRTKLERDFGNLLYSPQAASPSPITYEYSLVLEQNPKWHILDEILSEIKTFPPVIGQLGPVLIVVKDDVSKAQVTKYLATGGQAILKQSLLDHVKRRQMDRTRSSTTSSSNAPSSSWRGRGRGRGYRRGLGMAASRRGGIQRSEERPVHLTPVDIFLDNTAREIEDEQNGPGLGAINVNDESESFGGGNDFDEYFGLLSADVDFLSDSTIPQPIPLISIVTFDRFEWTLEEMRPQYIVLYDSDLALVRNIEVYKAYHPGTPCKVYFMSVKESAEEMLYTASVEREKNAFTSLIKEKEKMVVSEEQDGRLVVSKVVTDQLREAEAELNASAVDGSSRKGGTLSESSEKKGKVLVDTREFRSKLPNLLHLAGLEVIPITLEMGDYIITPDICIERKSIADLHGSFQSGRLITQTENLIRHYSQPVLLVEFDETQAFTLEEDTLPDNISVSHIISKMVLLTQAFPALRIVWSTSPQNTAQLFKSLKELKKEPTDISDGIRPHHRLLDDEAEVAMHESAFDAIDILKKMPGVNTNNVHALAKAAKNLRELSSFSKAKLQELIGKSNGAELFAFFNDTVFPDETRKVRLTE